jgi:hypothetical protein
MENAWFGRGWAVGCWVIHRHGEGSPGLAVSGSVYLGILADAPGEGGMYIPIMEHLPERRS